MTEAVGATGARRVTAPAPPTTTSAAASAASLPGLPEPTATATSPGDMLGEMLAMMTKMSQLSTSSTEQQLRAKHDQLDKARQEFLKKVADAIRKQEQAKKHQHHGFFGSIAHAVGSALGEVLGTVIDFTKDAVEAPVKITVGLAEGHNLANVMQSEIHAMLTNGDWASAVKGCTEGVVGFAGDLQDAIDGIAGDLASGKSMDQALERAGKKAWGSLKADILENKDFWKVAGALAKAASLAAAAMTGGALAWVAVGVFALCELDNKTGLIDKAFGKKAGPWVKLGLEVGGSALLGVAAASSHASDALRVFQAATAIADGTAKVGQGVKTIEDAKQRADEMRAQADVKQALDRMHRIQRMIDDLISVLEDKSDHQKNVQKLGAKLVQTQGAIQAAAIMRA